MQAVQGSWVGKTFALARCSDSGNKKPRSRHTKEERRTMVESFIKKYRNLNNGKFPSLNLTHKEVGGSFYTVREIVREIIQDNRVLAPGKLTSQALNLEHCLEEHAGEPFSMDISGPLSISTIGLAVNQRKEESYSLSKEHRRISEEIIEIDEFVTQEAFESHPIDTFVSEVLHEKPYHEDFSIGTCLNGKLVNYAEPNPGNLSVKADGISRVGEEKYSKVQISSFEDPGIHKVVQSIPLCQTASITPAGELVVNGDDSGYKSNDVARATKSSAAFISVPEIAASDGLPETNTSLNPLPVSASGNMQHYFCDREDSPLASASVKTCNPDRPQKTEDLTISCEISETSDSAEAVIAFMPLEKDSLINTSEPTETLLSSEVDEVSASLTKSISQNLNSPASVTTRSVLQLLLQPNDTEDVITNMKSDAGKSHQPHAEGRTYLEVKAEHECIVSNIGSTSNSSSISSEEPNKESETSEINPVWAAIKSLLNAVVKFWAE